MKDAEILQSFFPHLIWTWEQTECTSVEAGRKGGESAIVARMASEMKLMCKKSLLVLSVHDPVVEISEDFDTRCPSVEGATHVQSTVAVQLKKKSQKFVLQRPFFIVLGWRETSPAHFTTPAGSAANSRSQSSLRSAATGYCERSGRPSEPR